MARLEDAPPLIQTLAEGAPRLVMERLRFPIAFEVETLPVLDHFIGELRGEPDEDGRVAGFAVPCIGAYFGEVVRQTLPGATWALPADEEAYASYRLVFTELGVSFNPLGMALESLHGEPLADWHAHVAIPESDRELVAQSLENTGGVREEDYYRLAIRWEVLEQTTLLLSELRRRKLEELH